MKQEADKDIFENQKPYVSLKCALCLAVGIMDLTDSYLPGPNWSEEKR